MTINLATSGHGANVLVIGDVVLDRWLRGSARRLCREAPTPVVDVGQVDCRCGGAANVAANLAGLGARARLVGVVGDDPHGELLADLARQAGVQPELVVAAGRKTRVKSRIVADQQITARFDDGDHTAPARAVRDAMRAKVAGLIDEGIDAVLVCDYGQGTLSRDMIELMARRRRRIPRLAIDAHDLARWSDAAPDLVTPNAAEASALLGSPSGGVPDECGPPRLDWMRRQLPRLRRLTGARTVAVTMDVDGCLVFDGDGEVHHCPGHPAPISASTGAGDSYLAGFVLAQMAGHPVTAAADAAHAIAVTVLTGAQTRPARVSNAGDAIRSETDAIIDDVEQARRHGGRVVFTNGCFDVLHRGHVGYLQEARRLGDMLVVALNSDASTRRLKGPERPVNNEEDRVAVLRALSCVDAVLIFDEDSPVDLIKRVRPDVYVKGGDYRPELIPEADLVRRLGGAVRTLSYLPDRSTSAIIARIRERGGGVHA